MSSTGQPQTGPQISANQQSSHNRYVLWSVIVVVAVVAVYILKTNMEPPDTAGGGGVPVQPTAEEAMQQITQQIDHINEMLARDSTNFDAWAALGNLYYDAEMPEEAVDPYIRALAIKPDDPAVRTDLSTMLRSLGQHEEAAGHLRRVVDDDSTWHQAWFNLGVIYSFDLEDEQKALAAWKMFVILNPQSQHAQSVQREITRLEEELGG